MMPNVIYTLHCKVRIYTACIFAHLYTMDYATLASEAVIKTTETNLAPRNIIPHVVATRADALSKIKELIPAGASVQNGASRTLEEIGYIDYLKAGGHGWNNLHEAIVAETDPVKQGYLRKQATLSDFYLGSVHAITEEGELVIASNSGSQMPNIVFNSPNLIFVVGGQKIVPTLADAFKRLHDYVVPLEDARLLEAYGMHTQLSKTVIFHKEHPMLGRTVHVILVNEKLGF